MRVLRRRVFDDERLLPISRMGAGMGLYGTMNALAQAVGPDLGIRASRAIGPFAPSDCENPAMIGVPIMLLVM